MKLASSFFKRKLLTVANTMPPRTVCLDLRGDANAFTRYCFFTIDANFDTVKMSNNVLVLLVK